MKKEITEKIRVIEMLLVINIILYFALPYNSLLLWIMLISLLIISCGLYHFSKNINYKAGFKLAWSGLWLAILIAYCKVICAFEDLTSLYIDYHFTVLLFLCFHNLLNFMLSCKKIA